MGSCWESQEERIESILLPTREVADSLSLESQEERIERRKHPEELLHGHVLGNLRKRELKVLVLKRGQLFARLKNLRKRELKGTASLGASQPPELGISGREN